MLTDMDKLPVDLEMLKRLATDPLVQLILAAVAGSVVTFAATIAATALRLRGKRGVARARAALAAAKMTPGEQDDLAQQLVLANAEADQQVFDQLAAALERIKLAPRTTSVPMPTVTLKP